MRKGRRRGNDIERKGRREKGEKEGNREGGWRKERRKEIREGEEGMKRRHKTWAEGRKERWE